MDYDFRKTATEIAEIENQNENIKDINQNINERIKTSIYNKLASLNSVDLFKYIGIIVICGSVLNVLKFRPNMIVGVILGLMIVYLVYDKKNLTNSTFQDQLKIKLELIKPRPKNFNEYPELIELFYSIRDFYDYNATVFKQVIINVDLMILILNDIKQNIISCKYNVDILQDKKRKVLNNLSSMIFTIENNKLIERKLQKAVLELHKILNNLEKEAIAICNEQIVVKGYNNDRIYIHKKGPQPANIYNNRDNHYEVY
jgi:hypothetical protein